MMNIKHQLLTDKLMLALPPLGQNHHHLDQHLGGVGGLAGVGDGGAGANTSTGSDMAGDDLKNTIGVKQIHQADNSWDSGALLQLQG